MSATNKQKRVYKSLTNRKTIGKSFALNRIGVDRSKAYFALSKRGGFRKEATFTKEKKKKGARFYLSQFRFKPKSKQASANLGGNQSPNVRRKRQLNIHPQRAAK